MHTWLEAKAGVRRQQSFWGLGLFQGEKQGGWGEGESGAALPHWAQPLPLSLEGAWHHLGVLLLLSNQAQPQEGGMVLAHVCVRGSARHLRGDGRGGSVALASPEGKEGASCVFIRCQPPSSLPPKAILPSHLPPRPSSPHEAAGSTAGGACWGSPPSQGLLEGLAPRLQAGPPSAPSSMPPPCSLHCLRADVLPPVQRGRRGRGSNWRVGVPPAKGPAEAPQGLCSQKRFSKDGGAWRRENLSRVEAGSLSAASLPPPPAGSLPLLQP